MQIERRDPSDLKLHPLQKRLPEPDKNSREWISFVDSIRRNGILENLIITADGLIMDGGWRWRAAKALQLDEVPVTVRKEEEAALVIVESLLHRKQMTRGACIYLAIGLLPEFVSSANTRRLANLGNPAKRGKTAEIALKVPNGSNFHSTDESINDLCERWGITWKTFDQARRVRSLLYDPKCAELIKYYKTKAPSLDQVQIKQQQLREDWEPELLNGDKNLWNVTSSICGDLGDQSTRDDSKDASQLKFLFEGFEKVSNSGRHWNRFTHEKQEQAIEEWRKTAAGLPKPLRLKMAEVLNELD